MGLKNIFLLLEGEKIVDCLFVNGVFMKFIIFMYLFIVCVCSIVYKLVFLDVWDFLNFLLIYFFIFGLVGVVE